MADFVKAFDKMIVNEGGYVLHTVQGDTGGMTYAGIARNMNPQWSGWKAIDSGSMPDASEVRAFYKPLYWDAFKGDAVSSQKIAESIFDFGVNAGTGVSVKLAQEAAGALPDGAVGSKTRDAWNTIEERVFLERFALLKLKRYAAICNANRSQSKFLLGWLNRTLASI